MPKTSADHIATLRTMTADQDGISYLTSQGLDRQALQSLLADLGFTRLRSSTSMKDLRAMLAKQTISARIGRAILRDPQSKK